MLARLSDNDVDERLLCITALGSPSWDCRSGAPSRLGLAGGVALGDGRAGDWVDVVAFAGDAAVMTGWAGRRGGLDGESPSSRLLLNFWDDFRGGGLGGGGDSLFFFLFLSSFLSPSRTVPFDDDDDDVSDSLIAARVRGFAPALSPSLSLGTSFVKLPALARLPWRARGGGIRIEETMPGEWEEIEVGVVSRLYGPGPGDSENRVEGLPLTPLIRLLGAENSGVGGGRSCVAI